MTAIYWLNPTNNTFNTAAAWSTGTIPGASDNATIGVSGNYTVSVSAAFTVNSLTITDVGAVFATSGLADHITGNFVNAGLVQVDNQAGGQGGSAVTIGGSLRNSGTFNIGPGNNSLGAASTVTAATLSNSGTINVFGDFPGSFQATLHITGAAGFGSVGLLTGTVNLWGNSLLEFGSGQITKIAAGARLDLRGTARMADASNAAANSALAGLATNSGTLLIGDGDSVVTTGAFANIGFLGVDNEFGGQGGSTLTLGGALTNTGTIAIGPGNNSISAADTVKAASLANMGTINLYGAFGSSASQFQATLNIAGAAGFGTAGVLAGAVNLSGDTLLEFGSGQITSIAVGGRLDLRGDARLADASGAASNSALTGLANNSGTLLIGDGAAVQTTAGVAFTNSGYLGIDNEFAGQGGSALRLGGALTNSGTMAIGSSNNSLSANTTVTATALSNTGTVNLYGSFPGSAVGSLQASLSVAGAAGFGAAGVLTGAVNLTGDALLEFDTGGITSIAAGARLDLRGNARLANASNVATNSALTGLTTNSGTLLVGDGAVVVTTVTTGFANFGFLGVDNEFAGQGGSSLTLGGALINSGTVSIGPGNNSLSANTVVKVASVSNTGAINIAGNFPGVDQASLLVAGAAGFGTAGVLTGSVNLSGNSLLQFGSGQITRIAAGAELTLRGQSRLADASGAATNTALAGFFANAGSFFIGDGAVVKTTTVAALANSGLLSVDNEYAGQGGSSLTLGGALTNTGTVSIGPGNNSLSANTTVTATALNNTGALNILGNFPGVNQATLDITGAAGFGLAGVLSGAVTLSGNALLEFGSGQITKIATGAVLNLRGAARVADASNTASSTALTGLVANAGTLLLGDNEVVTSTTTSAFTNAGLIQIDNQFGGQGGSDLALGGTLFNSNTIAIGPSNSSLSGNDSLTAKGLSNTGTINLYGNLGEGSVATLGVTGTATNAGAININSGGAVTVTGGFVSTTGGVTTVQGGAALTAAAVTVSGGVLQGNGTVNGLLTLAGGDTSGGFVSGVTPGTLTVNGNLNVIGAAVVHELLSGAGSGQASRISMSSSSNVNLDGGALEADVSGFSLAAGQTYTVATFTPGRLTGVFKTIMSGQAAADGSAVDLGDGLTIGLVYGENAGSVQLAVVATPVTTLDHWLGGTADFATAADWDQGTPTFYSDVIIGNTASGHVTVSTDATINSLTLLSGDTLTDDAGATLSVGSTVAVGAGATLSAFGNIATGGALTDGGGVVVGNGTTTAQLTDEGALGGAGAWAVRAHALLLAEHGGTLTGAIANNGTIAVSGPLLALKGAVSGTGTLQIDARSEIELGGASANTVLFNGAAATLKLDTPSNFSGTLSHLGVGDVVDLGATNATSATVSGSTLQVGLQGGGSDSFNLASLGGDGFSLTHTAGGDTLLTDIGASVALTAGVDNLSFFSGANLVTAAAGTFNPTDIITGGGGVDTLLLDGNYAAGVTLGASTLTNFEAINTTAGDSYNLTLAAATDPSGKTLSVSGATLGAANSLTLDAHLTAGALNVTGGAGADAITLGAGAATVTGGGGSDVLNAGAGVDTFVYKALTDAGTTGDVINGFSLARPDVLNLHTLLSSFAGETSANAFSAGYLAFDVSGANTQVMVDADGSAGSGSAILLATLNGVHLTSANTANFVL